MTTLTQCFILPDVQVSQQLRNTLLVAGFDYRKIRFLADKKMHQGNVTLTPLLQESNLRTEAVNGLVYGLAFGLATGIYVLLVPNWMTTSPSWYSDAPWYVVLMVTMLSAALIMGLAAANLGAFVLNHRLQKYQNQIAQGKILMMISSPPQKGWLVRQIVAQILQKVPETVAQKHA